MAKTYIHQPVGRPELKALAELGQIEERAFFERNPHLVEPYRQHLLALALCQGAALQFLGRGYGVNDFDLHFFYAQNSAKPRLSRAVGRIWRSVGRFSNAPVDFVRTVVPGAQSTDDVEMVVRQLRRFLEQRRTANATHLATKAVIGLWPDALYGRTIWPVPATSDK